MSSNTLTIIGAAIILAMAAVLTAAYSTASSNLSDDDSIDEDGTDERIASIPNQKEAPWDLDAFIKRLDNLGSGNTIEAENAVLKGEHIIGKEAEKNPNLRTETHDDGANIEQEAFESQELIRQYKEVQQELRLGGSSQVNNEYSEVREGASNLAEINPLYPDAATSLAENQSLIASNQDEINTTTKAQTSIDQPSSSTHQATNNADQIETEGDETISNEITE